MQRTRPSRSGLASAIVYAVCACRMENPDFEDPRGDGPSSTSHVAAAESGTPDDGPSATDDGGSSGSGGHGGEGDVGSTAADDTNGTTGAASPGPVCDAADPDLLQCFDFESLAAASSPDGSSYGHHAQVEGAELVDGPWGRALRVDEMSTVAVVCQPDCTVSGALTIEASVLVTELPATDRAGLLDDDGQHGLFVTARGALRCSAGDGAIEGGAVAVGQWHHVACVYDGRSLVAYVDGSEVAAQPQSGALPPDDGSAVAMANTAPDWDEPLTGTLDRVRVWADARTAEELVAAAES
ncbi:MAG: LamG domain-containing protein [Myxococcota bacterium]